MMIMGLIAQVALSAVFAVSGGAKLLDRSGTRAAVQGFGLPRVLAGPIAIALPIVELALALALLTGPMIVASLVAITLLTVFTVLVGRVVRLGRAPACACFGSASTEPVSGRTIIRNLALLVVALLTFANTDASAIQRVLDLDGAGRAIVVLSVALALTIVVGARILLHLGRAHGRLLERISALEAGVAPLHGSTEVPSHGPPIGGPMPTTTVTTLDGAVVDLDSLIERGRPTMLAFTHPECGACANELPELLQWSTTLPERLGITLMVLSLGGSQATREFLSDLTDDPVLLDEAGISALDVPGTPAALLLDEGARVVSRIEAGPGAIGRLVNGPRQ